MQAEQAINRSFKPPSEGEEGNQCGLEANPARVVTCVRHAQMSGSEAAYSTPRQVMMKFQASGCCTSDEDARRLGWSWI